MKIQTKPSAPAWLATCALVVGVAWASTPPVHAQTGAEARAAVARVAARLEPEIRRAMLDGSIPSLTVALADDAEPRVREQVARHSTARGIHI